jgi:hypothetical protein
MVPLENWGAPQFIPLTLVDLICPIELTREQHPEELHALPQGYAIVYFPKSILLSMEPFEVGHFLVPFLVKK